MFDEKAMVNVESSNIEKLLYDVSEKKLYVMFKLGTIYEYEAVPEQIYNELLESESKGKYFLTFIRPKYKAKKFRGKTEKEE